MVSTTHIAALDAAFSQLDRRGLGMRIATNHEDLHAQLESQFQVVLRGPTPAVRIMQVDVPCETEQEAQAKRELLINAFVHAWIGDDDKVICKARSCAAMLRSRAKPYVDRGVQAFPISLLTIEVEEIAAILESLLTPK